MIFFLPSTGAQEIAVQEIRLYEAGIPGELAHESTELVSRDTHGNRGIAAVDKPTLSGVFPPEEKRNGTAVIIFPGGGYNHLAIDKEGFNVARRFAEKGVTAFVLKYRIPIDANMVTPYEAPLQDAQQALHVVRTHAEEWGLDNEKIGVMGFSAGGHLASTVATHFKEPINSAFQRKSMRPDFQILIYPVISMDDDITHQGSKNALLGENPAQGLVNTYSAEKNVTANTPQTYILHANDDRSVPVANALRYYQALTDKSVAVQMLLLPHGGHGFGLNHSFNWFGNLCEWMEMQALIPAN